MAKVDDFKQFVRRNPGLISYVNTNQTTWQKLYEVWDLYGEDNSVWNDYNSNRSITSTDEFGLKDIMNSIKKVNMDAVVKGLNGLQNLLGLVQDTISKNNTQSGDNYEPRPMYTHFDD